MKYTTLYKFIIYAITLAAWAPLISQADENKSAPEATVLAFNQAFTDSDAEALVALLADGGIQFTLRASHAGIDPEKLTADITAHWSVIAPVVFAATEKYTRQAKITDSQVKGEVASIWAEVSTESVRLGSDEVSKETFSELYLVINTADGWKIAAIADNRRTDKLDVSTGN
jgi:hypothetical protein